MYDPIATREASFAAIAAKEAGDPACIGMFEMVVIKMLVNAYGPATLGELREQQAARVIL